MANIAIIVSVLSGSLLSTKYFLVAIDNMAQ